MDPVRLTPSVELPVRRGRPRAVGAALALLFVALGARNYLASVRESPYAARAIMRLDLASAPDGATVVRERDGRPMCVTPCAIGIQAESGIAAFRFERDGYLDRRVLVSLAGGDTQVVAVLQPSH